MPELTYYEVKTEELQMEIVRKLEELYEEQWKRFQEKLKVERVLLEQLRSPEVQIAATTMLQALDIQHEFNRCQSILSDILSIYNGIETARRAAPTPPDHPPHGANSYSVQTGGRTEVRLSMDHHKSHHG